jgi:hypothetical protein
MVRLRALGRLTLVAAGVWGVLAFGAAAACSSFSGDAAGPEISEAGAETGPEAAPDPSDGGADGVSAAHTLDVAWARAFGPPGDGGGVFAGGIAVRASGESYTVGTYYGGTMEVGDASLPPADGEDAFVIDLASTGAVLGERAFGTFGDQLGTGIAALNGGFFVGVTYNNGLQFDTTHYGTEGAFNADVGRFNGAFSGEHPIMGTGNIQLRGLATASSESAIAFGEWDASIRVVGISSSPVGRTQPGHTAIFLTRMFSPTSANDAVTTFCDQGIETCTAAAVAVDAQQRVAIAGHFQGAVALAADAGSASSTGAGTDAYVALFDAKLRPQWIRAFGGAGSEEGLAVAAVPSTTHFVVAGTFDLDLDVAGSARVASKGGRDIFVARLDGSGAVVWLDTFGGTDNDTVRAVTVDAAGNVFLAGSFASPVIDFGGGGLKNADTLGVGSTDVFVAWLDGTGQYVYSTRFGGPANEAVAGLALDAVGHLLVTGSLQGTVDFGGTPLRSPGSSAAFVTQLTLR